MRLVHIRVVITLLATITAIIFIPLSYIYPDYSTLILTIEVILLPAIYIIGNYYAEYIVEQHYRKNLDYLESLVYELNSKVFNQEILINKYKEEIKNLKKS